MDNIYRKINLYILSLGVLFLFITIITINLPEENFIVNDAQAWKSLFASNIISFMSALMLVYSLFAYKKFEFDLKGATDIPFEIKKIESINYEHLTFLATYIIPLISFEFDNMRQMIVLALLLVIMGVIYIKTDLFYANPSLALLGFYIYKGDGMFKNGNRDGIVLISRKKLVVGQKVSYIKLDDRIYYTKGVK